MRPIIPTAALREEYAQELRRIFRLRINLFCYITISVFAIEVILGLFFFRNLLGKNDIPGIVGGTLFAAGLLITSSFAKPLAAEKVRGLVLSFLLISISILAALAHPGVIGQMGVTLVMVAFFLSALLLPWNALETMLIGVFALGNFLWIYPLAHIAGDPQIFAINAILLAIATMMCSIVKGSEGLMRQKDFVLKKEVEEKNRIMMRELELARTIHGGLIPKSMVTERADIAVTYKPMLYMGGDYAKFTFLDNNRLFFLIADVTGHGVSAALLVNRIHTEIESVVKSEQIPGAILRKLDDFIKADFGQMGIFLSAFCGLLDFSTGTLTYSNYGHPPQILFQKNGKKIHFMESQTFLMGIGLAASDIYEAKITFGRGDRIVLFTDGLVEAKDVHGEEFGYKRLEQCVQETALESVEGLNRELMDRLGRFQTREQTDDIFVVSLQIK